MKHKISHKLRHMTWVAQHCKHLVMDEAGRIRGRTQHAVVYDDAQDFPVDATPDAAFAPVLIETPLVPEPAPAPRRAPELIVQVPEPELMPAHAAAMTAAEAVIEIPPAVAASASPSILDPDMLRQDIEQQIRAAAGTADPPLADEADEPPPLPPPPNPGKIE